MARPLTNGRRPARAGAPAAAAAPPAAALGRGEADDDLVAGLEVLGRDGREVAVGDRGAHGDRLELALPGEHVDGAERAPPRRRAARAAARSGRRRRPARGAAARACPARAAAARAGARARVRPAARRLRRRAAALGSPAPARAGPAAAAGAAARRRPPRLGVVAWRRRRRRAGSGLKRSAAFGTRSTSWRTSTGTRTFGRHAGLELAGPWFATSIMTG